MTDALAMSRSGPAAAIVATLAVDMSAGLVAWAVTPALQAVTGPAEGFFAACAAAAGLTHGVLLPGMVWVRPIEPHVVIARAVMSLIALPAAVGVGLVVLWITILVPVLPLPLWVPSATAGAAVAGLISAIEHWAGRMDPGPVPSWVPMAGAVAGVWIVLGFSAEYASRPPAWGASPAYGAATLALAGLPHVLLVAWARWRGGAAWPPARSMLGAACACCLGLCAMAALISWLAA